MEIKTLAPQPVLSIRTATTRDKFQHLIDESLRTVWGYMQANKIASAGPPFARYYKWADDSVDVELGFPVGELTIPITDERIQYRELPGGETATSWHLGKYETLAGSWDKLYQTINSEGLTPSNAGWEVYWTDPGKTPNPEEWKTEILIPVRP